MSDTPCNDISFSMQCDICQQHFTFAHINLDVDKAPEAHKELLRQVDHFQHAHTHRRERPIERHTNESEGPR